MYLSDKSENGLDLFVDVVLDILFKESLLDNIKSAQQIDTLGIDSVYYLYKKIHKLDINDQKQNSELDSLLEYQIIDLIENFLLAATAKDCSIMITLLPVKKSSNLTPTLPFVNLSNSKYMYYYRIALVDLDKKTEDKIPYYYNLEQIISQTYLLFSQNVKKCVKNI